MNMHPFDVDYLMGIDSSKNTGNSYSNATSTPCRLANSDGEGTLSPNSSGASNTTSPQNMAQDPDVLRALQDLERQAARQPVSEDKPGLSYIALISMAILSSREKRLVLSDIYQWVMDNFEYYRNNKKAWRNSIRHNLSLNEYFVKGERSQDGRGHYWSIHAACVDDFKRGDYRRRHARRRAKKNDRELSETQPTRSLGLPMNTGYAQYPSPVSHLQSSYPIYSPPIPPMMPRAYPAIPPHNAYPQFPPIMPPSSPFPRQYPQSPRNQRPWP